MAQRPGFGFWAFKYETTEEDYEERPRHHIISSFASNES